MAYRLHRIDNVTEVPAWWNVGGTAFHECIREWETYVYAECESGADWPPPIERRPDADDQAERFRHHLAEQTAQTVLDSGVNLSAWRVARSGREDRDWWLDNAPGWVAAYVTAALARESHIETLGGAPAMEVEFLWRPPEPGLPGMKGFVDQVHRFPNGDILIRDLKSGSHKPVDPLQLQIYRLALEDEFGISAPRWWGDYWMARQGSATRAVDLTDRAPIERAVYARLAIMDAAERNGYYPANPSSLCSACGVRAACPVMGDPATARPWVLPTP